MTRATQAGQFCWWSLMTKDVERANRFYRELFGWGLTTIEIPGEEPSLIYTSGRGGFAHPVPLEPGFPGPSHWIAYLTVADVDAACRSVERLGGKVCLPAFDIPTIGRTAVVEDPIGAAFHLFSSFDPSDASSMIGDATGDICWMELMADDITPLTPFYGELFGWSFSEPMDINGGDYISFEKDGVKLGGLFQRPAAIPAMPPAWMVYFSVPSVDDYIEKVKAAGGSIQVAKTPIPQTGFFACFQDPTGASAYLFEWTEQES